MKYHGICMDSRCKGSFKSMLYQREEKKRLVVQYPSACQYAHQRITNGWSTTQGKKYWDCRKLWPDWPAQPYCMFLYRHYVCVCFMFVSVSACLCVFLHAMHVCMSRAYMCAWHLINSQNSTPAGASTSSSLASTQKLRKTFCIYDSVLTSPVCLIIKLFHPYGINCND